MRPFTGKLLSSTLLWCCLFFNFTQVAILENLSIVDLALSGLSGSRWVEYTRRGRNLDRLSVVSKMILANYQHIFPNSLVTSFTWYNKIRTRRNLTFCSNSLFKDNKCNTRHAFLQHKTHNKIQIEKGDNLPSKTFDNLPIKP